MRTPKVGSVSSGSHLSESISRALSSSRSKGRVAQAVQQQQRAEDRGFTLGGSSRGRSGLSEKSAPTVFSKASTSASKWKKDAPMRRSYYLFEQKEDGAYKSHELETNFGDELIDYYKWDQDRKARQGDLARDGEEVNTMNKDAIMENFDNQFEKNIFTSKANDSAKPGSETHSKVLGGLKQKYFKITDRSDEFRATTPDEVQEIYREYRALFQHVLKIPEHQRPHYDQNAVANAMVMAAKVVAIRKDYTTPLAFGYVWMENRAKDSAFEGADDPSVKNACYNWFIDTQGNIYFVDAVKGVNTESPGKDLTDIPDSGVSTKPPNKENKVICVFLY